MQRQAENPARPGRWSIIAAVAVWTLLIGGGLLQTLQEDRGHAVTYVCVWLLGLLGIAYGTRQIRTRSQERRRAEERLEKWEALLAVAVEQSPSGIIIADAPDAKIQYANRAALAIRGPSDQPLEGIAVAGHSPAWQIFLPDGVTPYPSERLPLSRAVLEGAVSDHVEAIIRREDGECRWITANAGPVRSKSGEIVAGIVVFHDVTERKRMEETIRAERDRAEQYLDVAGVILVALDVEGRVTLINRKGCEVLGYAEAELLGRCWFDIFLPAAVREPTWRFFRELISGSSSLSEYHENAVLTKAGEERIMAWHNKLIRDGRGRITGTLSSGEDITERKHAEQALRRSELLNRRLVEHLPQSVFVKDRSLAFTFCNANFSQPLGLKPEQIRGLDDFAFYPLELAEKYRADDRRVMETGKTSDFEELNCVGDVERWMHVVKVPYRDERGEVTGVMGIFEDITQRKQAEEEIRRLNVSLEQRVRERTARWEAANKELEAFTYSVSHDLRAPLRAINGYARLLAEGFGPRLDAEGLRILGVVCSEAERMGHLIDELLNFSRLGRSGLRPVPIDMTALVREVWAQCGPSFAQRQVDLVLAPLPPAAADLSLLRQVWTNLIDNALKFTRRRERARIEIGGWTREGENVYFVKDNGAGFDMNYADKLFRFFQRLHGLEEFEGNGVGLALVQRIIRLHSGRVWAESEVDRGAVFHFALPQAKEGGSMNLQRSDRKLESR